MVHNTCFRSGGSESFPITAASRAPVTLGRTLAHPIRQRSARMAKATASFASLEKPMSSCVLTRTPWGAKRCSNLHRKQKFTLWQFACLMATDNNFCILHCSCDFFFFISSIFILFCFTKFYFFTTPNNPLQEIARRFGVINCNSASDVVKNE